MFVFLEILYSVLWIIVCSFVPFLFGHFIVYSFWPFYCLFFFDLRFLITPMVPSNYSYKQIMIFQLINRQLRVNRKNLMKSEISFLLNVNKIIKRNTISYWEASHCVSLNLISFSFYWKPDIQDRCLSFYIWHLYCLFFFDIWILIAPLISSNSSC